MGCFLKPILHPGILLLGLVGVLWNGSASAQSLPEHTDEGGIKATHSYLPLESFEYFDPQSANIVLTFTDLELPGNNGRTLRFTRRFFNAQIDGGASPGGWASGIDGFVMYIENVYNVVPGTEFNSDAELAFRFGGPRLIMGDGGERQTFFMNLPDSYIWQTQRWVRTVDQLMLDQGDLGAKFPVTQVPTLYMHDGVKCTYEPAGWPKAYRLKQCSDQFGLFLSVNYEPPPSIKTTYTQHLGDGDERQVVIEPGPNQTSTMTYAGRTWTYVSNAEGTNLAEVVTPEGLHWTFEYAGPSDPGYRKLKRVQTPGGGTIEYTYVMREQWHSGEPLPTEHGIFLEKRLTSGPGVVPGEWELTDFDFAGPGSTLPTTYRVIRPSGAAVAFELCPGGAPSSYWMVGPDRGVCAQGGDLRGHADTYEIVVFQAYSVKSLRMFRRTRRDVMACGVPLDCATHRTDFVAFDAFSNPTTIEERDMDAPTVVRKTTRTYLNTQTPNPSGGTNLIGLLESELVELGGAFLSTWARGANGVVNGQDIGGIATTFVRDARGNVQQVTTGGKTTAFTYRWGVVKNTQAPEYLIEREINPYGTVAWEKYDTRQTTFTYDALGRVKSTDPPGASLVVQTSYNDAGRTITTTRGTSSVTTTLDGFGRPIRTVNSVGVETKTSYDAEGRMVYQSLPFAPGYPERGTSYTYDAASRVRLETHTDATFRERTYGRSTVTVRDEEGRQTVIRHQAFGNPDSARVTQIVDAAGQAWNYTYNVRNSLTGVSGPGGVTRTWTYNSEGLLATEMHPESGTVTYDDYDAAGMLKEKHDARGTQFLYTYDGNNRVRVIKATPPGQPEQQTTIDYESSSDRRTQTNVDGAVSVMQYDPEGRASGRTDTVDGKVFQASFGYDTRDNLIEVVYPTGRRVHYEYDSENRITRVFNPDTSQNYASAFSYHPSGAVTSYTAGNGLVTTLTYDQHRHWLTSISAGTLGLGYEYDGVGNIELITDARPAMGQGFAYDALDRLYHVVGMGEPGSYPEQAFAYDAHGNRQSTTISTYTYHANNPFWLQSINGFYNLQYDPNGNLTSGFGGTYEYTPDNLLDVSSIGGATTRFRYDADAWRVKKAVDGGITTYYSRGPTGQMLTEWVNTSPNATVRDYIYAGGRLIAVATTKQPAK